MSHPAEDHAHEIAGILAERFLASEPSIEVTVEGAGIHWACCVARGESACKIAIHDLRRGEFPGEYFTIFQRQAEDTAFARTPDREGTLAAVADWLEGAAVADLYASYPFIDARLRALTAIRDEVLFAVPELSDAVHFKQHAGDIYSLIWEEGDRSCRMYFYGDRNVPEAEFAWDRCRMFAYQVTDNAQLAQVLRRWIANHAQPSEMRLAFPSLAIGPLADAYERGEPIQGEFLQSWDSIEAFYQEDWCDFSEAAMSFIRQIRTAGYDHQLRAGQSLSTLGLSRSRRHGLRHEQPSIWIQFSQTTMRVQAEFASTTLKQHPIQLTPEVKHLLDALVELPIN